MLLFSFQFITTTACLGCHLNEEKHVCVSSFMSILTHIVCPEIKLKMSYRLHLNCVLVHLDEKGRRTSATSVNSSSEMFTSVELITKSLLPYTLV